MATGHRAAKSLQGLGRPVDKRRRIGIRNDLGKCAVEVQADERLSASNDADQLTVGVQRVRQGRHAIVAGADRDIAEVGYHDVGASMQQVVGMPASVHADDEREPALAPGLDTGVGIPDEDATLWRRTQCADGFQQDGRVRLVGRSRDPGFGQLARQKDGRVVVGA